MIEVAGLRKAYAGREVLAGIDLTVRPGEIVALLGPNGAGKTTTVEIIEGYRTADAGTVRVLGVDPRGGGATLKARVGLMLQGGVGLEPRATPRDLVGLYVSLYDGGPRADELIERVGLVAAARTRVRRLSGRRAAAPVPRDRAGGRSGGPHPRRAHGGHGPGGTSHHA